MDGDVMEILNTFEYVEKIPGWQIAILVVIGIVLIFLELALILCSAKIEKTRYECAIDDTASFIEIMENYDVVGRRGDLWILEDKADE